MEGPHFNEDLSCWFENDPLFTFYESPLGREMTSISPWIPKEGIIVAEQWAGYFEPLLIQAIEKTLKKGDTPLSKRTPNNRIGPNSCLSVGA